METQLHDFTAMGKISATRLIASTAGVMCGISGLEHGFFETLQGNVPPDQLLISAIGPANRFWPGGTETALTIVPNYLVTGLLAMLASALVIVWSAFFIQRRYGALVFFLLSVFQFLVGGGFAQIFLVLWVTAAATQINQLLKGWRTLLPSSLRRALAKLWLPLLVLFLLAFGSAIFAAVFGYVPIVNDLLHPSAEKMNSMLYSLGYSLLMLLPLTILAGIAQDIEGG